MVKRALIQNLILSLLIFAPIVPAKGDNDHKIDIVVLDAGHGGKDSGARGKHVQEKDIALSLALKVGGYIQENLPGVKVIYTRTTDVFVPLHERASIANNNNADLFISIHVNANPSSRPYGTETYAMGLHKSEENLRVAQLENSAILYEEDYEETYDGFDPNSSESYIIFSLIQDKFLLPYSLDFASNVQYQFREKANRKDRGVKQAGFLVLWKTTVPSVLIEAGFISNLNEEKYLMSEKGQDYIASAIYRAFKDYKIAFEEKNKPIEARPPSIAFKVQLASAQQPIPLDSPYFKDISNIEEIATGDMYKYAVGNETEYEKILSLKEKIQKDFPGAFVIATEAGKPIPLSTALEKTKGGSR